ncbi:MAG: hypothetical protein MJ114_01795 [Acetatifactor sp.]|nr:hypothetical protein [Acetatifactor sp.]
MSIKKYTSITKKSLAGLLAASMLLSLSACGSTTEEVSSEVIELVEPVTAGAKYEDVARRTMYETNLYNAMVCPQVQEYEMEVSGQRFEAYDVTPGLYVKKGETLLHSNTEDIDKQIKETRKSILEYESDHEEYLRDAKEELEKTAVERDKFADYMKRAEAAKPEEKITVTDPVTGLDNEEDNPEYIEWEKQYNQLDSSFRVQYIAYEKQQAAIEQNDELFKLDLAYRKTQLNRLIQDRQGNTIVSGMDGYVGAARFLSKGDWMDFNKPLMAVINKDKKEIRCEYISKGMINTAVEVYALVDGKRYDVDYQAIENEEKKQLEEKFGKAYSTFTLSDQSVELTLGQLVMIVVVKKSHEDVLCIPKDSLKSDDQGFFVYLIDGEKKNKTYVKTGMNDGFYLEITSGLQEGDHVMVEETTPVYGTKTEVLKTGTVNYAFKGTGYLYYPTSQWVVNPVEYGTSYYMENLVHNYQQVKKGEVLARIRVVADNVTLEKNQQKLERAKERLKDMIDIQKEDEYQKQIEAKQQEIADLEELIQDMKKNFAIKEIKSPIDGIITEVREYDTDSLLNYGAALYQIADESRSYIFVNDEKGQLSYGNQAVITFKGADGQQATATGEVVTLGDTEVSQYLSSDNKVYVGRNTYTRGTLVMVDPEYAGDLAGSNARNDGYWNRNTFQVEVKTREMKNVVKVPRRAVTEKNGITYVHVKNADGSISYKRFISGGSDGTSYWVVDGLTEGMEVCLE